MPLFIVPIGEAYADEELTSARLAKIEGYHLRAAKDPSLYDKAKDCWMVPLAIVNTCNEPEYGSIASRCMPTLTKSAHHYDLVSDAVISVESLWMTHGFPHPGAKISEGSTNRFPFASDMHATRSGLSYPTQRRLLGNSMHLNQIGSWFLFQTAFTQRQDSFSHGS